MWHDVDQQQQQQQQHLPSHWINNDVEELEARCVVKATAIPLQGQPTPKPSNVPSVPLSDSHNNAAFPAPTTPHLDTSNYPPEALQSIHLAAAHGALDIVAMFLKKGVHVDSKDADTFTALHWAAVNNRKDVVNLLISYGADVNTRGRDGQTALHWGSMQGNFAICYLLIEAASNVDLQDDYGFTALMRAVQQNFIGITRLLLRRGCNTGLAEYEGHTSLHWAAHFGHYDILSMLLKHLSSSSAVVDKKDQEGNTALAIACRHGNWSIISRLLAAGASLDVTNRSGEKPEDVAFNMGNKKDATILKFIRMFPFLQRFLREDQRNPQHMIAVMSSMFLGYLYYYFVLSSNTKSHFWLHVMFLLLTPAMILAYGRSSAGDPGEVKDNDEEIMRKLAKGDLDIDRVCVTCMVRKPLRSKHCRQCGFCIREMDHHCVWVNGCVGLGNRLSFFMFLITVVACLLSFCVLDVLYIADSPWVTIPELSFLTRVVYVLVDYPIAILFLIVYLLFSVFVFLVIVQLLQGMMSNLTTNERINWTRYKQFQKSDGTFTNPFDRGKYRNVIMFCDADNDDDDDNEDEENQNC